MCKLFELLKYYEGLETKVTLVAVEVMANVRAAAVSQAQLGRPTGGPDKVPRCTHHSGV